MPMPAGARDAVGAVPADGGDARLTAGHADPPGRGERPAWSRRHAPSCAKSAGPNFTVTQVVAAAGTSLKSFYRCFPGKDELLVALFEDDARRGAAALAALVGAVPGPARARARGRGRPVPVPRRRRPAPLCRRAGTRAPALGGVPSRPAARRPRALRRASSRTSCAAPRHTAPSGPATPDATPARLFHLVVSHLHALICHQIDEPPTEVADELWAFCAAAHCARDGLRHERPEADDQ